MLGGLLLSDITYWLFWIGIGLVILSFLLPWLSFLPFGRLPGDFYWQSDDGKFHFYFPLGTCLLISLALYLIQKIIAKI
tara:strand:- start:127 stop:363 length:237 start_codon:yes stop_codon:yes gene_type:complete